MKKLIIASILPIFVISGCANNQNSTSAMTETSQVERPIPVDSPFSKIQKGMGMQQVMTILGPPNDQESYVTGKAFIPFYFGADAARTKLYYKGLGQIYFGSGISGIQPVVNNIVYDPSEDGFKGDFGNNNTQAASASKQPLSLQFRGEWQGKMHLTKGGESDAILHLDSEPFKVDHPMLNCSGVATLISENSNSAEFSETITSGNSACVNNFKFKLTLDNKNTATMQWYVLSGTLAATGTLTKTVNFEAKTTTKPKGKHKAKRK